MKAYQFIQKYRTIEKVIENLTDKYQVPENWPYQKARELFKNPLVTPAEEIEVKFGEVDRKGLVEFLVDAKGFNAERVENYIERLIKARGKCQQKRMDAFFAVKSQKRASNGKEPSKKQKKWVVCCMKQEKKMNGLIVMWFACYAFLVDASFFSFAAFFGLQAFLDLAALGLAGSFFVSSSFSSCL